MRATPTPDEKMTAALAHASVLFSFLGPIVPAILWSSQRQKSDYVRFHALQALGYQTLFYWFWILGTFGMILLLVVLLIPVSMLAGRAANNVEFVPFLIQPIIFIVIFGIFGLYFLLGFMAAAFCFLGREFRYPFLGSWLEKYLTNGAELPGAINETREDNWVAGLCHATAILQMWGLILPLLVWVTQKDRSLRLKFQAVQAIIYQGVAFLAYILWTAVYMLSFLSMFFVLAVGGMLGNGNEISNPAGIVMLIVFLVMMIMGMLVTVLTPVYLIIALVAAIRVIRGGNFKYPILGTFLAHRMQVADDRKDL